MIVEANTLLVGGLLNNDSGLPSKTIAQMAPFFQSLRMVNGGNFQMMTSMFQTTGSELVIWMPKVDNLEGKYYPEKGTLQILICAKRLKPGQTALDGLDRLFKMHANAVILIDDSAGPGFTFTLVDALGNKWIKTRELETLCSAINDFYKWASSVKRIRSHVFSPRPDYTLLKSLAQINRKVAGKVEAIGGRYFGNTSTRCEKLFPSMCTESTQLLVSKRNIAKDSITENDFVVVDFSNGEVQYFGEEKPSVDTPVQAMLYALFPQYKFMIHGHTYIDGALMTSKYFPCGDTREVDEVALLIARIGKPAFTAINLKNHGFLMATDSLENLDKLADNCTFVKRDIGNEPV